MKGAYSERPQKNVQTHRVLGTPNGTGVRFKPFGTRKTVPHVNWHLVHQMVTLMRKLENTQVTLLLGDSLLE